MGRKESFSVIDPTYNGNSSDASMLHSSRGDGVYISKVTIFVYILFSVALATAVGCIVHFAHPCTKSEECGPALTTVTPPTTQHPDVVWEMCVNISWAKNECKILKRGKCVFA